MSAPDPLVSIGIPVYDGENYLAAALDSILAQTFTDFEVVICDNASTDDTEAICRRYAAKDERVRYHRQTHNLGAAPNYNDVYHRSRGEYFKWAAHDDLIEPEFLARCVAALNENPGGVLAFPGFARIDDQGNRIVVGEERPNLAADRAATRLTTSIHPYKKGGAGDVAIFGLIRRSALDRTYLHGSYTGSDRTLLAELALQGPFIPVPGQLFLNRDHPSRSIQIRRQKKAMGHVREAWFDSGRAGKIVFPNWRRLREITLAVLRASLPMGEKIRCLGELARWLVTWNWKRLANDLRLAASTAIGRAVRSRRESTDGAGGAVA